MIQIEGLQKIIQVKMDLYNKYADTELMDFLKSGNESAFIEIYNRYFNLLYIYAYKKLRDQDQAKDIIQDFFANLWLNRTEIKAINNLSSYFFTIINRKLIDHFLHQKVEAKYISSFAGFMQNEESKTDHLIREKQLLVFIEKEIQALPPRMREVFELSRKEHLTHKEIAGRLDISEKTVDRQVSNALKILRTRLGFVIWILFYFHFIYM